MDKALDPAVWLKQAELELNVAKHLVNNFVPKPLEIICFHAQQASEKAIKSVILHNPSHGSIAKSHDLSMLLDSIDKDNYPFDESFYDYADELFPYSVTTRYPNHLQDNIDEYKTQQAINHAEVFVNWAKNTILKEGLPIQP